MNIFELKKQLSRKYAEKSVVMSFSKECLSSIELDFAEGEPRHKVRYIYTKVLISPSGESPYLEKISRHCEVKDFFDVQKELSDCKCTAVTEDELSSLISLDKKDIVQEIQKISKKSKKSEKFLIDKLDALSRGNSNLTNVVLKV